MTPAEEAVYRWYIENPKSKEERIRRNSFEVMDDFFSVYGASEVEKDKAWVDNLKRRDERKFIKGEIFETIIREAETSDWFGEDCYISAASEFDDRKNAVDLVFEWEQGEGKEPLRITVDCTVTENQAVLRKKVKRIMKQVESGHLGTLKYFSSCEFEEEKGEKEQIPMVLLAISPEGLKELCESFVRVINKEEGGNKEFAEHYFGFYALRKIDSQLKEQRKLAEVNLGLARPRSERELRLKEAMEKIEKVINKISKLVKEKQSSLNQETIQRAEKKEDEFIFPSFPSFSSF